MLRVVVSCNSCPKCPQSCSLYPFFCLLAVAVWLKGTNIRLLCCAIWLVATVWSSFPLFGWGEYVPEPYGLSCTIAWQGYHTSAKDAFYVICSFACFTLVPVLLIVVSQCRILYKVSRFSYLLSARGIRNNLRRAEKRLSMVSFSLYIISADLTNTHELRMLRESSPGSARICCWVHTNRKFSISVRIVPKMTTRVSS